jgi:type IV pilus assembly protein PilM
MGFISSSSNSFLGVDIGSTSIKIVELKKQDGQAKLVSYGFSENLVAGKIDWLNNITLSAKIINNICQEAGITGTNAVSALPTFSVFSSIINLSNVSKKDLTQAVQWEAKKIIPMPLEDMILDWKNIEDNSGVETTNIKLLLTGAPRLLVKKYISIFKEAKMNLLSLETETFSLVRSLVGNDKSTVMVVEVGAETTDVAIVDNSIPMLSRSIDIGGKAITKDMAARLNLDLNAAEQFKYDLGVSSMDSKQDTMPSVVVILSGGSALLPNMANYLTKILDIKVIIGDPWARVSCPVDLNPLLNEIGPRMSIAIGLAMREMD